MNLFYQSLHKMMKQVKSESVVSDHLNSDKEIHKSLSQFQGSKYSVSFGLNANGKEVSFDTSVARSSFIIEESNAQPIDEKELLNSNVNFQNYDEISPIILTSTGEDNCARSDATAIIPSVFSIKGLNSQSIDKENYPVQSDAQDDSRRRKYVKPKRPCPFCKEFKYSLSRHFKLMHKNEPEVNRALSLPCDDRRKIFELLRKRGIDYENQKRLKSNSVQKSCERLDW
ncbi:Histone H2B [Armadillidium vulgare]|nr:Histone H2B [Armadillidium vulgare]